MPAVVTVQNFLEIVQKSKVLEEKKLKAFQERHGEDPSLDSPQKFAARLYKEGLVTEFQARQLLQGRWRRFLIDGKYKLLELLGQGGMGSVYLCEHVVLQKLVALKVVPEDKVNTPGTLERFQREARSLAMIDHPNIVRAFDMGRDDAVHYLVMEYVDGVNFERLISKYYKDQGIPYQRACHYISQAALGLQAAHEYGWIHRDIKPANILVDRGGSVKLLDLGLTRMFGEENDQLTKKFDEGSVLGTADYIAPEQALNVSGVDIRADIYGLGGTLYFLLAGHPPYNKGSVAQKLMWHQNRVPDPIETFRPDLPKPLAKLIAQMLEKKPENRPSTPYEVAQLLAEYVSDPIDAPGDKELPVHSPLLRDFLPTTSSSSSRKFKRGATAMFTALDMDRLPNRDTVKDRAENISTDKVRQKQSAPSGPPRRASDVPLTEVSEFPTLSQSNALSSRNINKTQAIIISLVSMLAVAILTLIVIVVMWAFTGKNT